MAEPKTKGMVALVPTAADAERLAVDGGLPVDELHLTLLFLGEAADWDDDARVALIDAMGAFAGSGVVEGDGFALSVFNPGDDDRDTAIVLGVGGQAIDDFHTAVVDAAPADNLPEQHAPWVAHTSLIYTDDLAMLADLVDRTGPVTFDRLRIAFADTVTDIPLAAVLDAPRDQVASQTGGLMNPFLRQPSASRRTPLRAERPDPKTTEGGVVTLRLYDPIDSWGDFWGVSAKEFAKTLDELPKDTTEIRLLINSPGGEVWEGLAILNMLRAHPAKVVAVVEGIAASSASFIAAGADELHVMKNAEIFVHRAWGGCVGNAEYMAKMAADLEHEDRNIASIYAGKAGGDIEDWLAAMSNETFYSAEEAVEAGLADRAIEPPKGGEDAASKAKARFDLSVFTNRARAEAPPQPVAAVTEPPTESTEGDPPPVTDPQPEPPGSPDAPTTPPDPGGVPVSPAAEPDPTEPKEERVSDDIRSLLGVPDDADDDAVKAAIEELKNKADQPAAPNPEREAELVTATNSIKELKDELGRVSAQLADRNEREAAAAKKALFDSAVKDGKIRPADRESWEARYDRASEVTAEILDALAPGTAVPVNAAGYTGGDEVDTDTDWDAAMARLDGPTATKGA